MTKNRKFSKFQSFYAVSVKISTDSVDWNVVNFHQGKNPLSSSLSWRDKCNFFKCKMSQIDTEKDKNPKIFQFQSFYAVFVIFSTDFVDWNLENSQQGKQILSKMLGEETNAVFQKKKVWN